MKKFMKTCGIMALVLILLGIVMTSVAGIAKGPEVVATAKKYIADGMEKLDSGVRFDIESDMDFDSNAPVLEGGVQQTYSAADVKNIDIEVGACELHMYPSEDEEFHVNVESAGSYQGYVTGGTLYIKAISSTSIGASLSANTSEINLDVDAPGCDISLYIPSDFRFEQMAISLGAGEIDAETVFGVGELKVELAAGEIQFPDLEVGKLSAEVGAGTLSFGGSVLETVEVECGMGEIELELVGTETDFNYQVQVAAGDVVIGNESFSGFAGEREIDNNAAKDIDIECAMGSVNVTFE